ncbi:tetR-family transcriptional regulator domain protein [Rhodococcus ruber]|nr:tetR-family transcriptional regulator domain protein [Rhodococcus ruber]
MPAVPVDERHERLHHRAQRVGVVGIGDRRPQQAPSGRGHDRDVEVLFGGEVAEQQAAGDAGDLGDPVDGQGVDRAGGQFLQADGDELAFALFRRKAPPLLGAHGWSLPLDGVLRARLV